MILAVFLTFLTGIIGYEVIEGWNLLDAIYMTVITLGTIGFGETHPLSDQGRVFTIFLILSGIGTVSYGALAVTSLVADGELLRLLKRQRMDRDIAKLQGHYIVCGAGQTGQHIIAELLEVGHAVVVVDKSAESLKPFQSGEALREFFGRPLVNARLYYLEADASREQTLLEAGLRQAAGIFCALSSDKENLFVVLTARGLSDSVRIVSKCQEDESEQKLYRAGTNRVVSPNRIGGLRMASEMVRPSVVSFLDLMLRDKRGYRFEEIEVSPTSPYVGRCLRDCPLSRERDITLVGSMFGPHGCEYNPAPDMVLQAGLRLVVLTRSQDVERLSKLVNG